MPSACVDCGYLAIKRVGSDELITPPEDIRAGGQFPTTFIERKGPTLDHEHQFFCFKERLRFGEEMAASALLNRRNSWEQNSQDVLRRPRECDQYFERKPGRSPKEHDEMKLLQAMEERTERCREEDRRWQHQQEALAETRHQEVRRDAKLSEKRTLRASALIALLGGVVAIAASVIAARLAATWGTYERPAPINVSQKANE
jgi:hypothetical protein